MPDTQFNNVSRASSSEIGENAAKQVLSLEIMSDKPLPTADDLNSSLPPSIRVFRIITVSPDFSARKNCDARTFEILVPTYVFTAPPEATNYCFASLTEPDEDYIMDDSPAGGLFNNNFNSSLGRRRTFRKSLSRRPSVPTDMLTEPASQAKEVPPIPAEMSWSRKPSSRPKRRSFWQKLKGCFGLDNKKTPSGSQQLKMVLNDTLRRGASQHGEGAFISETLKRSLSSKTQRDVIKQDIEEQDGEIGEEATFEPLDIPAPNAAGMSELQGYRMPRKQYETIQKTLAMFNGTHNWHNYIPNANPNDHRNFMRIVNLDMSPLEVHEGMEWIRFKVQANVFAKYQLRKMIAMLIMVVRTNTPRAVVANSYSVSQIDIPDSPGIGLILDEPHYNSFNAMAIQAGEQPVNFGASNAEVAAFREQHICQEIFKREKENMAFEAWIRTVDNYSFLYTQYLNQKGVISKQRTKFNFQ